ncbi:hypothetical protein Bpfe_017432 [Biomphalaria pfeifferi]|uniref:Uncharacterized protein n=1 Tax=Biomphalaria pfeifferi TaxID=112525 RepID=A0AAD8BGJ9_BIOPF|nr:hypothetical protein Bpfe_017432 [Biomphalaria pfeifferi]
MAEPTSILMTAPSCLHGVKGGGEQRQNSFRFDDEEEDGSFRSSVTKRMSTIRNKTHVYETTKNYVTKRNR